MYVRHTLSTLCKLVTFSKNHDFRWYLGEQQRNQQLPSGKSENSWENISIGYVLEYHCGFCVGNRVSKTHIHLKIHIQVAFCAGIQQLQSTERQFDEHHTYSWILLS